MNNGVQAHRTVISKDLKNNFSTRKKHTAEQNNGFCFVFLFLQCCCSLKLLLFGIAHDV